MSLQWITGRRAFRWAFAAIDATILCFGLWWLYTVSPTLALAPRPVFFIAATVVWMGEFIAQAPTGEGE